MGKTLYGALLTAHAERLSKQQVLILSECMTQKTVDLLRQFKPRRTFKGERIMGIDNRIQTAVVLPFVLKLNQQVLFVVKFRYVHFSMLFCLNSFKCEGKITNKQRKITIFVPSFENY